MYINVQLSYICNNKRLKKIVKSDRIFSPLNKYRKIFRSENDEIPIGKRNSDRKRRNSDRNFNFDNDLNHLNVVYF